MSAPRADAGADRWRWPITTGALVLAWLIVRSMAMGMAASGGSRSLARLLAPNGVAVLLDAADGDALRPGRGSDVGRRRLLDRVAVRAPLRYEPFLARALDDLALGRWAGAIRAAEAARSREPRSPAVRGVLLRAYLHQARYADAIGEAGVILARSDGAGERIFRLLTLLAGDPRAAPAMEAALRTDPRWRAAFVAYATTHAADRSLLFRVLLRRRGAPDERAAFLRALVADGDYDRAYLAWINFLTPTQAVRVEPVYDGDFREPTAPAPFNWTLRHDGLAAAERTRDTPLPGGTALSVRFFGRAATEIATETMLLPPGSYAFSALAGGPARTRFSGTLRWEIACLPSGLVLPLASLDRLRPRPIVLHAVAALPETGCPAQRLTLVGEPGDVATVMSAQFTRLRLDRR